MIYLFLERGERREKERERNINVQEKYQSVASCTPPTGDLAVALTVGNESGYFGLQDKTQPTEPNQSECYREF